MKLMERKIPWLKKTLDKEFQLSIRLRDTKGGVVRCISCRTPVRFGTSNCQAGHYVKKEISFVLRYDEKNCNVQCGGCNLNDGNLNGTFKKPGYAEGLRVKYGEPIFDYFDLKKHNKAKWTRFEYTLMIEHYRKENKDLKQQYGIAA